MANISAADLLIDIAAPAWATTLLEKQLQQWQHNTGEYWPQFCQLISQQKAQREFARVLITSNYAVSAIRDVVELFIDNLQDNAITKTLNPEEILPSLLALAKTASDEQAFMSALRKQRKLFMLRAIWREFGLQINSSEVMVELSAFAQASVNAAVIFAQFDMQKKFGLPAYINGPEQAALNVIAMGKLGAKELNLSSDIDLIFSYLENGETVGGSEAGISHARYFDLLARRVIRILDTHSADGFVFRVDMRLRPFGEAGALVWQQAALLDYYQTHGRDWERYAMIRARMICGPKSGLLTQLDPFIYRRYADFGALQSLQEMKALINRQVQIQKLSNDIKLGQGGIRELEFVVQALQLVRGGRETVLKTASLSKALQALVAIKDLTAADAEELQQAYVFLRHVEHGIQAFDDQQTQQLPRDELQQQRLAWVVLAGDWQQLLAELDAVRERVSKHFANTVSDEKAITVETTHSKSWQAVKQQQVASDLDEELNKALQLIVQRVKQRHDDTVTWERLDRFIPLWLKAIQGFDQSIMAITRQRSLSIILAILGRSTYLLLMSRQPMVLHLMLRFCSTSAWVASQLQAMPILLEELATVSEVASTPQRGELVDSLRQHLLRVASDDLETQMDLIRYFKAAKTFRAVCAQLLDLLPLTQVSDMLSYIAEAVLNQAYALAYQEMLAVYGQPCNVAGEALASSHFIIVAYGKLGGLELGFASDLDLVFVHDADSNGNTNHPQKPVSNAKFYARLGQRIIHIMSAATQFGQLYEVDMRLRPSGASGVLVTSLSALQQYQQQSAWTWEHQALVRARVIAGDGELAGEFKQLRDGVLRRSREAGPLREQVVEMRERMRRELGGAKQLSTVEIEQLPDLELKKYIKHGPGGMVDLEFLVQYLTLKSAPRQSHLKLYTDNLRLLQQLVKTNEVTASQANELIEAYQWQRRLQHYVSLEEPVSVEDKRKLADFCQIVHLSWIEITQSA